MADNERASTPTGTQIETGLLYSQIGYDIFDCKRALIRSNVPDTIAENTVFAVVNQKGETVYQSTVEFFGEKWGVYWWTLDFTEVNTKGTYYLNIMDADGTPFTCEPIEIDKQLLWKRTMKTVAIDQFTQRAERARNNSGWKDCGSTMREAYSHAVTIIGMCDLLADGYENFTPEENKVFLKQLIHGVEYIAKCQDKAEKCGFPRGAVVHEMAGTYTKQRIDALECALAFARTSTLIADSMPEKSDEYSMRAKLAFDFVIAEGPEENANGFSALVNGAPEGFTTPKEWASRYLCLLGWTALELAVVYPEYRKLAVEFADELLERQVPADKSEGGLYGHFYEFSPAAMEQQGGCFTQKANVHCGVGHDMGGVFPHYILFLISLSFGGEKAAQYRQAVLDFAYHYLLPACKDNPFGIMPQGYFPGKGLLTFSGPWHGTNVTYGFAATLAAKIAAFTEDTQFRDIAVNNIQWIAGLNAGITNSSFVGRTFWREEVPEGTVLPISMIEGIGHHYAKGWSSIKGSIPNGFSTNQQFRLEVIPSEETDCPNSFTDEDWIPPAGAWMSALSAIYQFDKYYDEYGCKV